MLDPHIAEDYVDLLRSFVSYLLASQSKAGSWPLHSKDQLDRVVCTCQALLLLYELGYRRQYSPHVTYALNWLRSPEIASWEYSWQAALPLILHYRESASGICKFESEKIWRQLGEDRVKPHPNFPREQFLFDCLNSSGRIAEDELPRWRKILGQLVQHVNKQARCPNSSYALSLLTGIAGSDKPSLNKISEGIQMLSNRLIRDNGDWLWDDNEISTAYVVLNVCGRNVALAKSLASEVLRACTRLHACLVKCVPRTAGSTYKRRRHLPLGAGDRVSVLYDLILISRALVSVLSAYNKDEYERLKEQLLQVTIHDIKKKAWLSAASLFGFILLGLTLIWSLNFNQWLSSLIAVVSFVGSVASIIALMDVFKRKNSLIQ